MRAFSVSSRAAISACSTDANPLDLAPLVFFLAGDARIGDDAFLGDAGALDPFAGGDFGFVDLAAALDLALTDIALGDDARLG